MSNIGNIHANVIKLFVNDDSFFATGIMNLEMPNTNLHEVIQPIGNLIMLSYNSRSCGTLVEDVSKHFSLRSIGGTDDSFAGDEGMNHDCPITKGVDVGPLPPPRSPVDLEPTEVT